MKLPLRDFADIISVLKGPADRSGGDGSELRGAPRMQVTARINAILADAKQNGRRFSVLTRDISLTGVGLLQSVAVTKGTEVVLALPRPTTPLFVVAVVTHCRGMADGIMGIGMEFVRLVPDDQARQFLSRDAEERARLQRSIID